MYRSYKHILRHLKQADPYIYAVAKTIDYSSWIKPKTYNTINYFQSLSSQIISQQLSGKAADTIFSRFEALFPHKRILPELVMQLENQTLRNVGMSWSKASYIKNIAESMLTKSIAWDKLAQMSDEEVITELTTIKGIGKWTAEMFLMFTMRREDVFSFGDLGLKNGIKKVYGIEHPTRKDMQRITEKWSPYRTYGSIALWKSVE